MAVMIVSWARYNPDPALQLPDNCINQVRTVFGTLDKNEACEIFATEFSASEYAAAGWKLIGHPSVLHVDTVVSADWEEHLAPPTTTQPTLQLVVNNTNED